METVVVAGGGASGIMAALTAAENRTRRVILLERQQRIGRKLMATGNGRCNLTKTGASIEHYHGEHPEFMLPAMEKLSSQVILRLRETYSNTAMDRPATNATASGIQSPVLVSVPT